MPKKQENVEAKKVKPNGTKTMVKSGQLSPDEAKQNLIDRGAPPDAPIFGWLARYKKRNS